MIHVGHPGGLSAAIAEALAKVDTAAGAARARYITTSPGQAETYQAKYEDAQSFAAGAGGPHPWVAADAAAFGLTDTQAAQAIIDQRDTWVALGAQIEQIRLTAKQLIRAAETPRAAFDAAGAAAEILSGL